jgi:uncharacterized protein
MTHGARQTQGVVTAMNRPDFYPHPVQGLSHLQTHISHIFLTGSFAYKLKKPVDLGFLDFRTLAQRRHFCLEELKLNRRLAPEVYLEVLAVVDTPPGPALAPLDQPGGQVLDYVLKMAQMDTGRMMDLLLDQGQVKESQVREMARVLARFYRQAGRGPSIDFSGRPQQVRINLEENFRQTEHAEGVTVSPARWQAVADYSLDFLAGQRELFEKRVAGGHIVDGHGDLHSGNINLPEAGRPIIFDCIEFNERFRHQDLACDLAFLAMDLDFHGRQELSAALLEEFVRRSGDHGLAEVLDFYKCYRAVVRAKVFGFMYEDPEVEASERFRDLDKARAYWRLAAGYAGGEPPYYLVCLMGLMGTGKSYLALELAGASGWRYLSSDELRKEQAGLESGARSYDAWGQGLYGPEANEATYQGLLEAAREQLAMGAGVIVDASLRDDSWRQRFLSLAAQEGAGVLFVEVAAAPEVVARRLDRRQAQGSGASDGRRQLMAAQAAAWQRPSPKVAASIMTLDGAGPAGENVAMVLARLREMGLGQGGGPLRPPRKT